MSALSDVARQTSSKSEDGKFWVKYNSQFRALRQNNSAAILNGAVGVEFGLVFSKVS